MFDEGYTLPNVGPTPKGAPVDVPNKPGRTLNELEAAHLYIAELETRVQRMPNRNGRWRGSRRSRPG